jgi:acetyltransferase
MYSFTDTPVVRTPDFAGRPRRINLEKIVAVKSYGKLKLRPIRMEDEEEMVRFHQSLPEESIYLRYFEYLGLDRRTAHERLVRICTNTAESYAIVVEKPATPHHPAEILAVGRLTKTKAPYIASFDTLMIEETRPTALAKILLERLITLARAFGYRDLNREVLVADHESVSLCRRLGFAVESFPRDGLVLVSLVL